MTTFEDIEKLLDKEQMLHGFSDNCKRSLGFAILNLVEKVERRHDLKQPSLLKDVDSTTTNGMKGDTP